MSNEIFVLTSSKKLFTWLILQCIVEFTSLQ